MKINSANSTNFQAITYRPGCQKYVAEYLTSRDKGVLRRAERAICIVSGQMIYCGSNDYWL